MGRPWIHVAFNLPRPTSVENLSGELLSGFFPKLKGTYWSESLCIFIRHYGTVVTIMYLTEQRYQTFQVAHGTFDTYLLDSIKSLKCIFELSKTVTHVHI